MASRVLFRIRKIVIEYYRENYPEKDYMTIVRYVTDYNNAVLGIVTTICRDECGVFVFDSGVQRVIVNEFYPVSIKQVKKFL